MNKFSSSAYPMFSWLLLPLLLVLILLPATGSCETLRNYKIKAGFTYRFILFSEWPVGTFDENSDEFIVGIVGQSPFNDFFDQALGVLVDERKLVIREFPDEIVAEELLGCQVVFIHGSHAKQVHSILQKLAGSPVLTISDVAGFLDKGGMIEFSTYRNRIRFAVNRYGSDLVGISFRAQMLKMATQVRGEKHD